MNALAIDTGKLSFHIRNLEGLIAQTSTGKYALTKMGENAVHFTKDVGSWAMQAEVTRSPTILPVTTLLKRSYAFLVDFALVFSFSMITEIVPNLFTAIASGGAVFLDLNIVYFLILFWIYFTLLEGFAGQSLGKRLLRIKVIRVDGKNLSYDYAAVRNFGKAFLLPIDLLLGQRLKDARFARYFDKFAGTTVIDLQV
jgi:uncharacterized RDD family membrane protein YckC